MTVEEREHQMALIMDRMSRIRACDLIPDMTKAEVWLLAAIVERKQESMKVSDLCRVLKMHPSAISRLLRGLEEKDLVLRSLRKDNKRITDLTVTERGREVNERNRNLLHRYWEEVLRPIPEKDLDDLLLVWNAIADSMEEVLNRSKEEDV